MSAVTIDTTMADRRLHVWGRLALAAGIIISLGAPIWLFTVEGLWPGWAIIATSLAGLAAVVSVSWIVEPLTYFPMLGVAGTYQAWLVGNISNKLLPAAITAQSALDAKPGSRRAELVSIAAISGAVIVHVTSLILLVAIGGTWIVSVLPPAATAAFGYVLPAVLGPVFVQLAMTLKSWKVVLCALAFGAAVTFLLVPALPGISPAAMPIVVIFTIAAALVLARRAHRKQEEAR